MRIVSHVRVKSITQRIRNIAYVLLAFSACPTFAADESRSVTLRFPAGTVVELSFVRVTHWDSPEPSPELQFTGRYVQLSPALEKSLNALKLDSDSLIGKVALKDGRYFRDGQITFDLRSWPRSDAHALMKCFPNGWWTDYRGNITTDRRSVLIDQVYDDRDETCEPIRYETDEEYEIVGRWPR